MLFISGPYTSKASDISLSYTETSENIQNAREAAIFCALNLIPFFCPHLHTAHFELFCPSVPVEFFYKLDMQFASICNGIILLKNWEFSTGARKELEYFELYNLPVFRFPEQKNMIASWWQFSLAREEQEKHA